MIRRTLPGRLGVIFSQHHRMKLVRFARYQQPSKLQLETAEFAVFLEASRHQSIETKLTAQTFCTYGGSHEHLRWTIILAGGTIAAVLGLWTGPTIRPLRRILERRRKPISGCLPDSQRSVISR
jgi:hypothetical protein